MIDKPGLYNDVSEIDYHADCVGPAPSLSASIVKVIARETPAHAKLKHPRLNPKLTESDPTRPREIGTASHKLILGRGRDLFIIDAKDYKSGAAQAERKAAYAKGDAPILKVDLDAAHAIADAAKKAAEGTEIEEALFGPGDSEVTAVWQDVGGIWCRSRFDRLPLSAREGGHVIIPDVKTIGTSAHPLEWQRSMADNGADIQDVFYTRGLKVLAPAVKSARMLFLVIEQKEPFAASVLEPSGEAIEVARGNVRVGMARWWEATTTNNWPGYPKETQQVDPPVYHSIKSESRQLADAALLERMAKWQAPLELDAVKP